jgi:hypothetical protein
MTTWRWQQDQRDAHSQGRRQAQRPKRQGHRANHFDRKALTLKLENLFRELINQ